MLCLSDQDLDAVLAVVRDRVGPERFRFLLELPDGELLALMWEIIAIPRRDRQGVVR